MDDKRFVYEKKKYFLIFYFKRWTLYIWGMEVKIYYIMFLVYYRLPYRSI